ncbi:M56 family metallopeptidase [Microbulbifer pacificus]|uniref:M56 family metallopeptidase n=1 Tax=Microbulbifer pacificus TaxID=407164 RepID=A0AAU0MWR3_9GAMM|nr:M56 family metallopeptidase [Microbulbifer pacificus]WOX04620.1 M56 family metallopeptidase [Microbulbifer pacificus]
MINWVLEQQEVLTLALLVVWLSDLALAKRIGAKFTYRLYALVPLALIFVNLPPIEFDSSAATSESAYLVSETLATTFNTVNEYQVTQNLTSNSANNVQWIWLFGVGTLLTGLLVGLVRLATIPKSPVLDERQYHRLPSGIFYTSNKVKGPILKGIFKPEIILPTDYQKCYEPQQLDYVFEHELVHANRFDNLWNLLSLIFAIFFWFNPVVWVVYLRFRLTQECACDEEVLSQADKHKKILYSRAMLQSYEHWNGFWMLQSHYGDKMTMITRINRLKTALKPSKLARLFAGWISAAILSLAFLWGQASANTKNTINLNELNLFNLSLPRAAFFEGIQGEVYLQFDVEEGVVSSVKVLEVVTSGGHEEEFVESATNFIKTLPFSGENANLTAAEYVARFHMAGVGASQVARDKALKRMPHRKIHLLPYSIPTAANEISFSGTPKLQYIKNHYPSYPEGLEALGVSASAIVELDVRESGIAVNPRVISVDAPAEYQDAFRQTALHEADNLNVFKNNSGQPLENVKVELRWSPADYSKGVDASKLKRN